MRMFFAGGETWADTLMEVGVKNILCSYHYLSEKGSPPVRDMFDDQRSIIMDSGGFTARKAGTPIDVHAYARYLKEHGSELFAAANLDTNCVIESLENQKILDQHSPVSVLPVYHIDEYIDPKQRGLLDEFIRNGYPYIAIGGMVGNKFPHDQKRRFLSYVFSRTKDRIKVHGFGITSFKTMKAFPFYSVDSSTWISAMKFGRMNKLVNGKFTQVKRLRSGIIDDHIVFGTYQERIRFNIREFLRAEKFITDLWRKRGVLWI